MKKLIPEGVHPNITESNSISKLNLVVGDLVTICGTGIIYRVININNPVRDAVSVHKIVKTKTWHGEIYKHKRQCWCDTKGKEIPKKKVFGSIEIEHMFSLFQTEKAPGAKKSIANNAAIWWITKLDVLTLGRNFAQFQLFLIDEVKRYQSS